jgi:hypothetical protein
MLGNGETVAWLTPHAAIVRANGRAETYFYELRVGTGAFNGDGKGMVAVGTSPEHLLEICDVVLRLLAATVVHSLVLGKKMELS